MNCNENKENQHNSKEKQQKGQMYLTKSKTSDELRRQKQKKWKKQHLQQIQ